MIQTRLMVMVETLIQMTLTVKSKINWNNLSQKTQRLMRIKMITKNLQKKKRDLRNHLKRN